MMRQKHPRSFIHFKQPIDLHALKDSLMQKTGNVIDENLKIFRSKDLDTQFQIWYLLNISTELPKCHANHV